MDVPPLRPLLKWINKDHIHKTIAALVELGQDPYALPANFFRRNVHDQRRYFEVALKLSYCNTCKSPRPDQSMHTASTCIECHELKEAAWEEIRTQRHDKLVHYGATNRYERNKEKRMRMDAVLSRLSAGKQESPHVDASIGEKPTIVLPKEHSADDILGAASKRETRNGGDK